MYHENEREDKTHEMNNKLHTFEHKRSIILLPISMFYYIHRLDGNYWHPASSGAQHNQRPRRSLPLGSMKTVRIIIMHMRTMTNLAVHVIALKTVVVLEV